MPQQHADGNRPGPERAGQPHHISSIAHLFFGDETARRDGAVRLAVAGLGATRAAAFACAGLVAGSRHLARDRTGERVVLREKADLTWTAASFLASSSRSAPEPDRYPHAAKRGDRQPVDRHESGGGDVRWDHLGPLGSETLDRLERWRGALTAGPGVAEGSVPGPGRDGVVLCLTPVEAGAWRTAFTLSRVMGLLQPARLEVLLFPDSWLGAGGGKPAGGSDGLSGWFRRLVRAICPVCEVRLTSGLPEHGTDAARRVGPILQDVAGRLLADFGVDPGS